MARWSWRRKNVSTTYLSADIVLINPTGFKRTSAILSIWRLKIRPHALQCMHRKSAGKKRNNRSCCCDGIVTSNHRGLRCYGTYHTYFQKMQVRDPSAPAFDRALINDLIVGGILPQRKLEFMKKNDPKSYCASLIFDRPNRCYNWSAPIIRFPLQLCRANAFSKSHSSMMYRLQGIRDLEGRPQSLGSICLKNVRHQQAYYHVQQSRKLDIRLTREWRGHELPFAYIFKTITAMRHQERHPKIVDQRTVKDYKKLRHILHSIYPTEINAHLQKL